ncbi:MAG: nucleotide sugar dehydrogenase [Peptococcia bacterium]|jgi:UDP-N-acetyl-D-mannosaminuronic acid dehydrogenase
MEQKKICVIGLGYIGLPTSAMFATHGCKVIGVDTNEKVVEALNKGEIALEEPYLALMAEAAIKSGNLKAATKPQEADAFIITVPTPITEEKKADMSHIVSATELIVPYLRKDNVVILESTSPAGTTEELMVPILKKSGLKIGEELFVGHSPERVLPGKILWELVNNNRIVGGINKASAEKIRDLYKIFVNADIYLTTATTAEMCKTMENTFRDVNIALANELAKICEKIGINAWEVIELCNRHPRVNLHQPSPGVGGHCLAVDPWFIIEQNPELAKIIELSRKTNDSMPYYVLTRIDEILKDIPGNKKVSILGITYKPNIDDVRESPILKLIELMDKREDYLVSVYDPYVSTYKYQAKDLLDVSRNSDLLLLAVDHDNFKKLPLNEMAKVMRNRNFFDTRNFLAKDKVAEKGFTYFLLGKGQK